MDDKLAQVLVLYAKWSYANTEKEVLEDEAF